MRYMHRFAEERIEKLNKIFKVILVNGARQVGKTRMLKELCKDEKRIYVTFDDVNARSLALNDAKMFFKRYDLPILIDEVQYAKNIFSEIKLLVDDKDFKGIVWLTGSQNYNIMGKVTESLAGRIGLMNLYSFHKSEIDDKYLNNINQFSYDEMIKYYKNDKDLEPNIKTIFDSILAGGMPGTLELNKDEKKEYFNSYIESYLLRDVVEFGKVQDIYKFRKFLLAITVFAGEQLNYKKISDACEVSQPTVKDWIYLLEGMGIVYLLKPFSHSELKRLSKSSKLYFLDTGLLCFLAKRDKSLIDDLDNGRFYENYVVSEFIKKYGTINPSAEFYYYRDSNMNEIDLIYNDGNIICPFEIKLSASPNTKLVKRFELLKGNYKIGNGGIICMCSELLPIDAKNNIIPCTLL